MTRLYELAADYAAIQRAAEDGEDCTDALAAINDALEVKAANIARLLRNLDADEGALASEVARLDAKLNAVRNQRKRLKDYVRDCMLAAGCHRIAAPGFTLYLQAHEHVEVDDLSAVPPEYKRTKPAETSADKKAILAAHKQHGEVVEGTRVVETRSLMIK
jgi:hypothetical protein